jgi:hypothetical protein
MLAAENHFNVLKLEQTWEPKSSGPPMIRTPSLLSKHASRDSKTWLPQDPKNDLRERQEYSLAEQEQQIA